VAVRIDGHCSNLGATVNFIRAHGRLGQKGEAALSVGLKGRNSAKELSRMTRVASIDESSGMPRSLQLREFRVERVMMNLRPACGLSQGVESFLALGILSPQFGAFGVVGVVVEHILGR
jgi:hypothetical protein